jgi:hypothetical protein
MTDQNEATQEAETVTQQEAMPTSDQKTSETEETTKVAERETEVAETGDELPSEAKERTREQFEKLKSQLAQERERRTRLERVFSKPQPQAAQSRVPEWYDPDSQTVDVYKLQNREQILQQKIGQLETQLTGITRKEEESQEKEAYTAYPELNPKSGKDFDERFQKQLISYMATEFAEGKNPTMKQAADDIVALAERRAKKAEKEGATKALESLSPKEQAALEATGRSDRRLPQEDLESIRAKTRQGGRSGTEAIMKRLSKIRSV